MSEPTMIERVARAIATKRGDYSEGAGWLGDETHAHGLECARAAIEAMREPTDAMIVAGDGRILAHLNCHEIMDAIPTPSQNCFATMIDKALEESK